MPNIDPAALSRPAENGSTGISPLMMTKSSATPSTSSTTMNAPQPPKPSKSSTMVARLDLEGPYTQLKSLIGEGWSTYKEAMGLYFLGHIAAPELAHRLSPLLSDPLIASKHNSLVAILTANIARDLPDPGVVAPFVSANDKPSAAISKPASGDAYEQRLKNEVMGLPARDRRRVKEAGREALATLNANGVVIGGPTGVTGDEVSALQADAELVKLLREERKMKEVRVPDQSAVGPASAGGLGKTNWALSVLPLYTAPTTLEAFDLPSLSTLTTRLTPMCYSYGLASGAAPNVPTLLLTALNTHLKTILTNMLTKTRSNGPPLTGLNTASAAVAANSAGGGASAGFVTTARFRAQLDREEREWLEGRTGGIERGPAGRLPVEKRAVEQWEGLGRGDLSVVRALGGGEFAAGIIGEEEPWDEETWEPLGGPVNGTGAGGDAMEVDDDGGGWEGGTEEDRNQLSRVLGECLALGS